MRWLDGTHVGRGLVGSDEIVQDGDELCRGGFFLGLWKGGERSRKGGERSRKARERSRRGGGMSRRGGGGSRKGSEGSRKGRERSRKGI